MKSLRLNTEMFRLNVTYSMLVPVKSLVGRKLGFYSCSGRSKVVQGFGQNQSKFTRVQSLHKKTKMTQSCSKISIFVWKSCFVSSVSSIKKISRATNHSSLLTIVYTEFLNYKLQTGADPGGKCGGSISPPAIFNVIFDE